MNPYLIAFFVIVAGFLAICWGRAYAMRPETRTWGDSDPFAPVAYDYYETTSGSLVRHIPGEFPEMFSLVGWLRWHNDGSIDLIPILEAEARTNFAEAFEQ